MTAHIENATLNPLGDGYTWHDMSYSGANQQADAIWYTRYASAWTSIAIRALEDCS